MPQPRLERARFSYSLQFDTSAGMIDEVFDMDGLKVFVDATSIMYLNGCRSLLSEGFWLYQAWHNERPRWQTDSR